MASSPDHHSWQGAPLLKTAKVESYDEIAPFQSAAASSRDQYPAQSGRSAQSGVPGRRNSPAGLPYGHDHGTSASPAGLRLKRSASCRHTFRSRS
jgi:hypothetical protein